MSSEGKNNIKELMMYKRLGGARRIYLFAGQATEGLCVVIAFGVGAGVGLDVGAGVGLGVGAGVGLGVGAGVGAKTQLPL